MHGSCLLRTSCCSTFLLGLNPLPGCFSSVGKSEEFVLQYALFSHQVIDIGRMLSFLIVLSVCSFQVYDAETLLTDVVVLDAQNLAAGPVAKIHLPHHIPPGML